jgi:hypothetical protein
LKIDISQANPEPIAVDTDRFFPIGIEIIGSELFFIKWTDSEIGADTLNKIDLNEENPQVITILNNLNRPRYLTILQWLSLHFSTRQSLKNFRSIT